MTHWQKFSVLVAEDDFLVSKEICRILDNLGHQVVATAANGEQALEFCKKHEPDVVLMDIRMPKLDGIAAAAKLQEENPLPVVILTAHESPDIVEQASNAGVGAFLTKPPRQEELSRALVIAVARHQDLMNVRALNERLESALTELKILRGMLPICAICKRIRNDDGFWEQVEVYFREHSNVEFTHGLCPECVREHYTEMLDEE